MINWDPILDRSVHYCVCWQQTRPNKNHSFQMFPRARFHTSKITAGPCGHCFDRRSRRLPFQADGLTPLSRAAHKGHDTCVNALLTAGADVNTQTSKGMPVYVYIFLSIFLIFQLC